MELMRVKVLKTVSVAADDSGIHAREIVAGTHDDIPADAFPGLKAEGYVTDPEPLDHDEDGGKGGSKATDAGDEVMTAAALLAALAADPPMEWPTFRAEARKILGDDAPEKKKEIVAALEALVEDEKAETEAVAESQGALV